MGSDFLLQFCILCVEVLTTLKKISSLQITKFVKLIKYDLYSRKRFTTSSLFNSHLCSCTVNVLVFPRGLYLGNPSRTSFSWWCWNLLEDSGFSAWCLLAVSICLYCSLVTGPKLNQPSLPSSNLFPALFPILVITCKNYPVLKVETSQSYQSFPVPHTTLRKDYIH